ncbi:MAG TPA: hypothetical protein PL149_09560 [Candidatus Kapabacteria bacterium]|nr:hypothetical protein [Candidatus Kapabacteria bacterium]
MKNVASLLLLLILISSCGNKSELEKKPVSRNVIILLDLSDRILLENQIARDKSTINAIFQTYLNLIKDTIVAYDKEFNRISDKFSVRIAYQKNIPYDKQHFENILQFDFARKDANNAKFILQDFPKQLSTELDNLYNAAKFSDNSKDYHGADIWKFFSEDLDNLISDDDNSINYLFIITDGYLYFENYKENIKQTNRRPDMQFLSELRNKNWEEKFDKEDWGLIPLNKQFPNLKVCVLEIAPNDFWNEFDLLKKVWSKWLTEMGIDRNNIYFSKSENTEVTTSLVKKVLR